MIGPGFVAAAAAQMCIRPLVIAIVTLLAIGGLIGFGIATLIQ